MTSKLPSLEEMKTAVKTYLLDPSAIEGVAAIGALEPQALASIFEAAFSEQPPRGLAYAEEADDLSEWMGRTSQDGCEEIEVRMLAMPFQSTWLIDQCTDDRHPWLRDATIDMVRAMATYFLRTNAYWLAYGDRNDMTIEQAREAAALEPVNDTADAEVHQ